MPSDATYLHPKKGLNPHLTFCTRCGGGADEVILLGARDKKITCPSCGRVNYGSTLSEKCNKCGHPLFSGDATTIEDHEKLPSTCNACRKVLREIDAAVKAGGVYYRCADCGTDGAILASPFAQKVREQAGIQPPDPVGVTFTKETCPVCHKTGGETG